MEVFHSEEVVGRVSAKSLFDGRGDVLLLLDGEVGVDRNGERFVRRFFGFGEVAFFVAEIFKAWLQMERNGIIDVTAGNFYDKLTTYYEYLEETK